MDELEQLDEGFGLEIITKEKKQELRRIEASLLKAKEESATISTKNERPWQERTELYSLTLEMEHRELVLERE